MRGDCVVEVKWDKAYLKEPAKTFKKVVVNHNIVCKL